MVGKGRRASAEEREPGAKDSANPEGHGGHRLYRLLARVSEGLKWLPECRAFLAECLRLCSFLPRRFHKRAQEAFPPDEASATPPPTPARRLLDTSLLLVLTTLVGFLIMEFVSPFGLADAAQARSQQISARLLAPFYSSAAQDRIAVVLIDDQTLEYRGVGWPPQYIYYSDVIRRVLEHRPAAVFLDVMVEHPRPYDDSLAIAREDLRAVVNQSGIPVYLAVSAPGRQSLLGSEGEGLHSAVTSWRNLGDGYPLRLDGSTGEQGQVFDLAQGLGSEAIDDAVKAVPGGTALPLGRPADSRSPAWLLYESVCADGGEQCREPAADTRAALLPDDKELPRDPETGLPKQPGVAMHVRWGIARPVLKQAQLAGIDKNDCLRTEKALFPEKAIWMVEQAGHSLVSGVFSGLDEDRRPLCPPFLVVGEEQLDVMAFPGDPELEGELSLLEGRVVLIGTRLQGAHDLIDTPVQAKMPGVLIHAMALDNLMHWGAGISDVPSKARHMFMQLVTGCVLSILFAVFWVYAPTLKPWMAGASFVGLAAGGLLLVCWAGLAAGWDPKSWMRWGLGAGGAVLLAMAAIQWRWRFRWWVAVPFVAAAVAACVTSLVIVVWLRMPPPDWLGLLSLATGMFLLFHDRGQA